MGRWILMAGEGHGAREMSTGEGNRWVQARVMAHDGGGAHSDRHGGEMGGFQ